MWLTTPKGRVIEVDEELYRDLSNITGIDAVYAYGAARDEEIDREESVRAVGDGHSVSDSTLDR
jgi:hypothetical protein